MAITFRHDAAAVALPSNTANRKYGQNLVLQQQQQKYQSQQAGYDRLFDAYKQDRENAFQGLRDINQQAFQQNQARQQNDFLLGRDKAQFEMQQREAEAARQRAFMDDARKQSSGMIMADIQNGEYDPATARKLQQNLVAEAEALGNTGLDATQRAEALQKIRAERALLTANRLQKPPPPSPQDEFTQGIVTDPTTGMRYRKNSKGDWEPLPEPEGGQQPQRPQTAQEFYKENPDQMKKDVDAEQKRLEAKVKVGEITAEEASRDAAWKNVQEAYDWQQKALGIVGEPTLAPELPSQAAPPADQPMQSILEPPHVSTSETDASSVSANKPSWENAPQEQRDLAAVLIDGLNGRIDLDAYRSAYDEWTNRYGNPEERDMYDALAEKLEAENGGSATQESLALRAKGVIAAEGPLTPFSYEPPAATPPTAAMPDQGRPPSPPLNRAPSEPSMRLDVARSDGRAVYASPGGGTTLGEAPDPNAPNTRIDVARADGRATYVNPNGGTTLGAAPAQNAPSMIPEGSQNPWSEVAGNDTTKKSGAQANPAQPTPPNFGDMIAKATDDADRNFYGKMQEIYTGGSPEIQAAIGVMLNPDSTEKDATDAYKYLKENGIDPYALSATPKKPQRRMSNQGRGM